MDSPVPLLSLAIYENDVNTRTDLVVKACKIITDVLPFDRKNHALIEEPELMKYLMLALPLNPNAIDMIILSMINKFKKLHYFLKELWLGFITIATIEEYENEMVRKSETALRFYQNGVKKLLKLGTLKELDGGIDQQSSNRAFDYCEPINENKEMIKVTVLQYVDKIVEAYFKELKDTVPFKPDIPDLLKKFIMHSPSDKVIIRSCSVLEKVSLGERNPMMNQEIEELVVTKKSRVQEKNKHPSKTSLDGSKTPQPRNNFSHFTKSGGPPSLSETGRQLTDSTLRAQNMKEALRRNQTMPIQKESIKDIDDALELGGKEVSTINDIQDSIEYAQVQLEQWLSSEQLEDIPLISRNINIHDMLKREGNLEVLLTFIFDPQFYSLGECWKRIFPDWEDPTENSIENKTPPTPEPFVFKAQKLKEDSTLHPYVMRSFKAMQVLCEIRNLKYLSQVDRKTFMKYFSFLYVCLNERDDAFCNYNHIAQVTEFLMVKETEICINYLIYYNLFYKLAQNLEFPLVQHFFLTLFNCSFNQNHMNAESFEKILKYCEIVSFFNDFAFSILVGPKGYDKEKFEIDYKPPGIESLINGAIKLSDFSMLFGEKVNNNNNNVQSNIVSPLLEDELDGINLDIDNIGPVLKAGKDFDIGKLRELKQKGTKPKRSLSESTINRYASLREKFHPVEGANSLADIREAVEAEEESPEAKNYRSAQKKNMLPGQNFNSFLLNPPPPSSQNQKTRGSLLGGDSNQQRPINTPNQKPQSSRRPESNVSSYGRNEESKKDAVKGSFDPAKSDSFKNMKSGKTTGKEDAGNISYSHTKDRSVGGSRQGGSRSNLESRMGMGRGHVNIKPERVTLASEFYNDAMTYEDAQLLNQLYPISNGSRTESDIDKESKRPEYLVHNIKANDVYSLPACDLLETLFQKMLAGKTQENHETQFENDEHKGKKMRYEMNKKLGHLDFDYHRFWGVIFGNNNQCFEYLMKNYLFKIKVHHLGEANSGFSAGRVVNLILKNLNEGHEDLKSFFPQIHEVCRGYVKFLAKVIIQSHSSHHDQKCYLQNLEVNEPLGSAKILLAETLNWILKNDHIEKYTIINEINDTCWHTLILWFFNNRTNNVYHRIFYSLLETTFIHCEERVMLNLLIKLDIMAKMHKALNEIYLNNVCIKDNHPESVIFYLKKIANLVDNIVYNSDGLMLLKTNLATSASWNHIKSKLCVKRPEKKKIGTNIKGGRRGSRLATRESNSQSPGLYQSRSNFRSPTGHQNYQSTKEVAASRESLSRGSTRSINLK